MHDLRFLWIRLCRRNKGSAFVTVSAFAAVSAWVNYFISGGAKKMAENANSPPLL
ncbi:hypothetical protein CUS_6590 [Ruminococcus albus 8]|uniref:Uncharacterized protein n=1 Tax=Ruminococcus albus 8 TaxID=246199 RepID=E9SBB7_RUMAL|nr:hypothetical protein CUS_6590 [Ruminococcus albus 8]